MSNVRPFIVCSLVSSIAGAALCYFTVSRAALPASKGNTVEVSEAPVQAFATAEGSPSAALTLVAIDKLRTELLAKLEGNAKVEARDGVQAEAAHPAQQPREVDRAAAGEQADTTLREAIHAGIWAEKDRDVLRLTLGKLDDDTCLAIQRELANAINERRIKVAYAGPPW